MPAPIFGTPGTLDSTAGVNAEPGIPADVHDGTMVLGIMSIVSNVNPAAGSGFSMKYDSEAMGATANPNIFVQWKRATGDEGPGTYTWPTETAFGQLNAQVWPVENEEDDADPFFTSASALRTAATSTYGTVALNDVPAGATLVWVGAQGGIRQTSGPAGWERVSTAGVDLQQHVFVLEDYAGGDPSVSGVVYIGGNTSNTVLLFAILPSADVPKQGSASGGHTWTGSASGEAVHSGSASGGHAWGGSADGESGGSSGSASGGHAWSGSASGSAVHSGSASGGHQWFGTAEGPFPPTEYIEDWADLNDVNDTGVQVSGNRLYSIDSAGQHGYTKALDFPPDGIWREQQLIYNEAGTPAPVIKLGFSCGDPNTGVTETDPDALGIVMEFGTRARDSFKGSNLSGVAILDETIVGVGPTTTEPLLFTIDATENDYSFALKAESATRAMISFRVSRADLADAGKVPTKLFAYIEDDRELSGSSLSPFIFQTGTLGPPETGTVAGQQIEGRVQHIVQTKPDDASPFTWWTATPPNMTDNTPVVIHIPQSLTGEGHDAWTDVRMEDVTRAIIEAGFVWVSSTDTTDRFANLIELGNYDDLVAHIESVIGGGRDLFTFGTSMGTMAAITLLARGVLPIRAVQTLGFAGSFRWLWDNVTEKRPEIIAAYGVAPDGSDLEAKTAGFDPLLSFVGDADFAGKGFRFNTGSTDAITPTELSDDMSTIVLDAGATEGVVTEYPGGHLDIDQYQGDDLVAFYLRHLSTPEGSASGGWTASGTASGSAARSGSASGGWQAGGLASGEHEAAGSASGGHEWAGTASGERDSAGSATGGHEWGGTATGSIAHRGVASGAHEWSGSAGGEVERAGSASGSHVWSGSAQGFNGDVNFATGAWVAGGSATGSHEAQGSASGGHEWSGSASGSKPHSGSASGGWEAGGTASGERQSSGSASGDHEWGGTAVGSKPHAGSASGGHEWGGTASGVSTPLTIPRHPTATIRANRSGAGIRANRIGAHIE